MKTIVILDDEPGSVQGMEGILQRHGFVVFPVATAKEAAAIAGRPDISVDLLIAGLTLPGNTTAKELHESCPEIPMLLLSESPLEQWPEDEFLYFKSLASRTDFLRKPLKAAAFVSRINSLLYNSTYTAGRQIFEAAAALRPRQVQEVA
jgi:DNA-binding response OmpR family regulator